MLVYPGVVPGGMVRDPVDDHRHVPRVAFTHQGLEILDRAEFRVHGAVVLDAIRGIDRIEFAYLENRHEPDHIGSEFRNGIQMVPHRVEGIPRREIPRIDLIHHHILRMRGNEGGRVGRCGTPAARAAGAHCRQQQGKNQVFSHIVFICHENQTRKSAERVRDTVRSQYGSASVRILSLPPLRRTMLRMAPTAMMHVLEIRKKS